MLYLESYYFDYIIKNMKALFLLCSLISIVSSQYYIRRYFLDQTKGEGTAEDKYHQMNYLQVWDQVDIMFMEYPDTGYMWIVDPTEHANDSFFGIRDNVVMNDRESGT